MSRADAISLLNQIASVCRTLTAASVVSVTLDSASGKWKVSAKWTAEGKEKEYINRIAQENGYSVEEIEGFTVLQKF